MTKRDVAMLACKIVALYAFYYSTVWLGFLVHSLSMGIIPAALSLVFGIILWHKAERIADRMVGTSEEVVSVKFNSEDILAIAFSVVGLVIILSAIPSIFSLVLQYWLSDDLSRAAVFASAQRQAMMVIYFLEIIVGAWLLLGSRGFVRLIKSVRTVGLKRREGLTERDQQ